MPGFTKLSNLVDEDITIERVEGFLWKKWDASQNRMLTSESYAEGYRKLYQVVTDKGQIDLGPGQMGNLLEGVMHAGKSDIIGCTFHVKSNGKSGMEIRYFLNPVRMPKPEQKSLDEEEPISLEDIPF